MIYSATEWALRLRELLQRKDELVSVSADAKKLMSRKDIRDVYHLFAALSEVFDE